MKTEKTGRLLTRTIATTKEQARTIADLRLEVAKTATRIQDAVDTAVAATIEEWSAYLHEHKIQIGEQRLRTDEQQALRVAAERARDNNATALQLMTDTCAALERRAHAAEARLAALTDAETAIKVKEQELRELVASVQDRMRRREREEANAILNRQAVAGLMPALRRG